MLIFIISTFSLFSTLVACSVLPVVIWHGMGDSCCNPKSVGGFAERLSEHLDTYVASIKIGDTDDQDVNYSFFDRIDRQIEIVCRQLKQDARLSGGFNALGFSQGGLFLRGYVQRCNDPPVNNLLTFGSPHAGVADAPGCLEDTLKCKLMHSLIEKGVYWPWVQNRVVQAQYFKEWQHYDDYLAKSLYLADINNERVVNRGYVKRLNSLKKLVLVTFRNDTMLVPPSSSVHCVISGSHSSTLPVNWNR